MKVLVNARFFGVPSRHAKFRFLLGNLLQLGRVNSPVSILIVTDLPEAESIISATMQPMKSVIRLEMVQESRAGLWRMIYWYDFRLVSWVKDFKPDLVLHGDHFCSLRLAVPQFMLGDDILRNHLKGVSAWNYRVFSKRWNKMIAKVSGIITWSSEYYEKFLREIPEAADRIFFSKLIPIKTIQSVEWEEKQLILNRLSSGIEFFLAVMEGADSPQTLTELLKGFSWFKKRFHSGLKLMVLGVEKQKWLKEVSLESYKYRNDVILNDITHYLEALSVCYAMLYVSGKEHMPLAIPEAFQSGVPVAAVKDSLSLTVSSDAVAWNDDPDPEQWGRLMGELYKDENFRRQLINKGFEWVENESDIAGKSVQVWLHYLTQAQIVPLRSYE